MANNTTQQLGPCPRCGEPLRKPDVLIEYETKDGDRRRWADCQGCGDVVDPD